MMSSQYQSWLLDEDEEDVESSASRALLEEIKETVVFTLDWSVGSIIEQLKSGNIDLQPQYQRRDAWTLPRKSRLIESLMLGLPVPPIVLAEQSEQKGSFLVLDGKQRLTTLFQFVGGIPTSAANGFRLKDLPVLTELEGLALEALPRQHLTALINQPIRTVILRNWKTDELLHLVFHRLNSNVVPLSPQELRQALIRGPFLGFLNEFSANSTVIQQLLGLDGPDFRMRDSELLLRLLSFDMFLNDYRGDLRKFLDSTARRINSEWDACRPQVTERLHAIEDCVSQWARALGDFKFVGRRYREGRIDRRFNRALLDAEVAAALDADAGEVLRRAPEMAVDALVRLQQSDQDFVRSIESTTKSIEAVRYRSTALIGEIVRMKG